MLRELKEIELPLHSTMFLLILGSSVKKLRASYFTFHYVSINTFSYFYLIILRKSLHSTMFLLILAKLADDPVFQRTLHSTMFLLIPEAEKSQMFGNMPLHSTMFLLIPVQDHEIAIAF